MLELISFGGILFWFLFFTFIILEGALLYNNQNWTSVLTGIIFFAFLYLLVPGTPEFNYKFLLIYPILALFWLPVYWYLELRKTAYSIKAALVREKDLSAVYNSNDYKHLRRHLDIINAYEKDLKVNIKHPQGNNLFANTLFFPISIIIFFSDSAIRMVIDQITEWMEEVREKFNNMFNDINKDKQ